MTLSDAFAALDAHYARTLDRLARPDALRAAPRSDAWSEAQHLWHADAVARGSLGALRQIQRGSWADAAVHPKARAVLDGGILPRGFAAPEAFVPPTDVDLDALRRDLGKRRDAFAALAADPSALAATGTFAHPRFGPLGAEDWVRFTALHTVHHDRLIDEIDGDAAGAAGPDAASDRDG